jgi:hypothetical protein
MSDDNVRTMWTDDELDAALAGLHPQPAPEPAVLAAAWTRITREAGTINGTVPDLPSTQDTGGAVRGRLRWTAVAAAAAVIAAIGGVAAHFAGSPAGGTSPRIVTAAVVLRDAGAAAVQEQDTPVPPGEFRYLAEHGVSTNPVTGSTGRTLVFQDEYVDQTWIPADRTQLWTSIDTQQGTTRWIVGSAAEAQAAGITPMEPASTTEVAPCGDFAPSVGRSVSRDANSTTPIGSCADPVIRHGSWQNPTPDWQASLPRDPRKLLDQLVRDAPHNGRGNQEALNYAADALRTGLLTADLRGALYQALALLPNIRITQQTATLDGRTGTAFAVDDNNLDHLREEIIIDPKTGAFIGERDIALSTALGVPVGTVMDSSSISTAIVAKAGTPG